MQTNSAQRMPGGAAVDAALKMVNPALRQQVGDMLRARQAALVSAANREKSVPYAAAANSVRGSSPATRTAAVSGLTYFPLPTDSSNNAPNGSTPGFLVQGSDGTIYGDTAAGRPVPGTSLSEPGSIFRFIPNNPAGSDYNSLFFFPVTDPNSQPVREADGAGPSVLVQASDGNIYGVTGGGGFYGDTNPGSTSNPCVSGGCGTVFRLRSTAGGPGVIEVLHSFMAGTDGYIPAGLVQGSDGNLYGVTEAGGNPGGGCSEVTNGGSSIANDGCGTLYRINLPSGQFETLYHFGNGDHVLLPLLLISGFDGNIYGDSLLVGPVDASSGSLAAAGGFGGIFRVTLPIAGVPAVSTIGHLSADANISQGIFAFGLAQGADGNFYGTTLLGGPGQCIQGGNGSFIGCGTVYRMTPDGHITVLHGFAGGTDGAEPTILTAASDGNIYGTTLVSLIQGSQSQQFGTVYQIALPGGGFSVLDTFTDASTGEIPEDIIQGCDGNLYGGVAGPGAGGIFRAALSAPRPVSAACGAGTLAFAPQFRQPRGTAVYSNAVGLSGVIRQPTRIYTSGGHLSLNGGPLVSSATANSGDNLRLEVVTANADNTPASVTLRIAGFSAAVTFTATTGSTVPSPFSFAPATNVAPGTLLYSAPVVIDGITAPSLATPGAGSHMSINGGPAQNGGLVNPGDSVRLLLLTSRADNTPVSGSLSIGGVSATFTATTGDSAPDPFAFAPVGGAPANSVQYSNPVTIAGISRPVPISAQPGHFSINGGRLLTQGMVNIGDSVRAEGIAPAAAGGSTTIVIRVGNGQAGFQISTTP